MKQLTPTLVKTLERYSKLKRLEKKIADSIGLEREKILDYTGRKPEILSFNDEKRASILVVLRESIDTQLLKTELLEVAEKFKKITESLQLRLY